MGKIEDFGEKIGGARKDLWKTNGLQVEDLKQLNEAEKRRFVTRDSVWPLSNAKALVEQGTEPLVAYWQRKVRLCVRKEPLIASSDDFDTHIEKYVKEVNYLRKLTMECKQISDIDRVERIFRSWKNDFSVEFTVNAPVSYTSISSLVDLCSLTYYRGRFARYVKTKNFPYLEKTVAKRKATKKAFIPAQLTHIEREGENYRHGFHVTPARWQREFNFRGIEFGNWMSQKDRLVSMDYCYDALKDLANVLDINDTDITFNGRLSLAFGARGQGGASAHYETDREVINLTKMHGAGTTAHEWFHALDDYIGKFYQVPDGKMASKTNFQNLIPESFKQLMKACQYDSEGNKTDFYRGSERFDQCYKKSTYGYWGSSSEMLARAFACYVKDMLGYKSDYLIAHADCYVLETENEHACAIPQGEERELLNELFDHLFYDLKKREILNKRTRLESKVVDIPSDYTHEHIKTEIEMDEFTGQMCFSF